MTSDNLPAEKAAKQHDAFCECAACCALWASIGNYEDDSTDDAEEYDDEDDLDSWAREIANE